MNPFSIEDLDPSGDLRQSADDAGAWDPNGTRRNLLRKAGIGGAAVFGVGALLSPLDALASATSGQKGEYSTPGSRSIRRGAPNANDVKIGNYALTLEYLEAAFYAAAAGKNYPDADIAAAAKTLAAHEAAHVAALKKVLGRAAVKAPTVNADTVGKLLADQVTFIKTAAAIEPVGTAAYAGAGPYINNLGIVKAALSIHSVEANHAAYTAAIVKFKGYDTSSDPIPNAFNPAFSFNKTITDRHRPRPRHGRPAAVVTRPTTGPSSRLRAARRVSAAAAAVEETQRPEQRLRAAPAVRVHVDVAAQVPARHDDRLLGAELADAALAVARSRARSSSTRPSAARAPGS